MDDQHEKIIGHDDLTQDQIYLMNEIRGKAGEVSELISRLEAAEYLLSIDRCQCDKRWIAIGKTDLQKGFMALTRSVAKPESF